MKLKLNCDLGEGEPPARTRALMRWIHSANVACGGHGGSVRTMRDCVRWAKEAGVRLGAHPGLWSRHDFGRGRAALSADELETLLVHQVGALQRIAAAEGVELRHVKLHGALYHAAERQAPMRRRYLETVQRWWPELAVYAQAGGAVANLARRKGVRVVEEGFLDRVYLDAKTLAPRSRPGAVWTDAAQVVERLVHWRETGTVISESGRAYALKVETWCVHADTPGAVRLVKILAAKIADF